MDDGAIQGQNLDIEWKEVDGTHYWRIAGTSDRWTPKEKVDISVNEQVTEDKKEIDTNPNEALEKKVDSNHKFLLNSAIIGIFLLIILSPQGPLGISYLDWMGADCGETEGYDPYAELTEACMEQKSEAGGIVFICFSATIFGLVFVNKSRDISQTNFKVNSEKSENNLKKENENGQIFLLFLVIVVAIAAISFILENVE